jgi:hypothetical protein
MAQMILKIQGKPEPKEQRKVLRPMGLSGKRNRLRSVSPKRAKLNREYEKAKRIWWAARLEIDYGSCQVTEWDEHRELRRCYRAAMPQPHHIYGRGKYLCDSSTFMAVCPTHHQWIHQHPKEARARGYIVYEFRD